LLGMRLNSEKSVAKTEKGTTRFPNKIEQPKRNIKVILKCIICAHF